MYIKTYSDIMARRPVAVHVAPSTDDMVMQSFEQDGSGIVSKFHGKVGAKLFPKWRPQPDSKGTEYEGKTEHHYPYHNFLGPGTMLRLRLMRGDEPVDFPDACALEHDKEYQEIHDGIVAGKYSEADVKRLVRESDKKLMDCLKGDKNASSLMRSFITRKIIASKTKLEDLKIMNASKFVQPEAMKPLPVESSGPVETTDPADVQTGGQYLMRKERNAETPTYACCEACHKNHGCCMKKPGYALKMKMFGKKKKK